MKIIHLPINPANYAWKLAEAQRRLGHQALILSRTTFGNFPCDILLPPYTDPLRWNYLMYRLRPLITDADIVHIHGGIRISQLFYRLLRHYGIKVAIHYHGTETRRGGGLHHQDIGDMLFYTPPDLYSYLPRRARYLPQLAPDDNPLAAVEHGDRVIFTHIVSSEKGTDKIIDLFMQAFGPVKFITGAQVKTLDSKTYPTTLRIYDNVPHIYVLRAIQESDVIIDQITPYGIYGTVAVEGMAYGKPVVCSIKREFYPPNCPIIQPHPLRLRNLVRDEYSRRVFGELGRKYVEIVHDPIKIAKKTIAAYHANL